MKPQVKPIKIKQHKKELSPFGKAFFECHQILQIAQFEADLEGKTKPDAGDIVDGYFENLALNQYDNMKGML
tara:strand:- start:447 stop:662 length:216 start_codon:yes stop_codon:yes gene_type:complete